MRMVSDAMGLFGGQDGLSVRGFACFTPFVLRTSTGFFRGCWVVVCFGCFCCVVVGWWWCFLFCCCCHKLATAFP